jgi:hypothetical protein
MIFCLILLQAGTALEINVSSPKNGARFESCTNITLQATFDVPDEDVKRVYFYQNGKAIRSVRQAPWEYVWEEVPDGIYEVHARLTTNNNENVYSDSIQVFVGPITDGDKIINGEFSCGTLPWRIGLSGDASAELVIEEEGWLSDEETMAFVDILNPGAENWHVMLIQPFPIDSGHTYQIYFTAEVEDIKNIGVDFQGTTDDFPVHFWQNVEVTSDNYEYGPIEFFCPVTDHSNEFKLALSAEPASIYLDAIKVVDLNWEKNETRVERDISAVQNFELFQNYPNPFNPSTEIQFQLTQNEKVELSIFDLQGRLVQTLVNGTRAAGMHTVAWDGKHADGHSAPSGIYIYQLKTENFESAKRMLLIK